MKFQNPVKLFIFFVLALIVIPNIYAVKALKFAHVYEISHPLHKGALMAAKMLKERTDGRYEIKVFPASSLGKETAINEGLSLGTVDIIYTGAGFSGSFYPPISISDFPFTFRGFNHWKSYKDSSLFRELAKGYTGATGNNIVAVSYYGARHVTANKPILKPTDMKNLKIRIPNAPAYILFPKAIGANPTPMAFSEVYLALQQGTVDAQENPLPTIQAKKFYEVQSNINLTSHIINSIFLITSDNALKNMSEKDHAIFYSVMKESADWVTDQVVASEKSLVKWFRNKGIKVNEVNRKPFIEKVRPALLGKDMPFSNDVYNRLQALKDAK